MSQILPPRSFWGRGPIPHANQNVAITSPEALKPNLTVVELIAGKKRHVFSGKENARCYS